VLGMVEVRYFEDKTKKKSDGMGASIGIYGSVNGRRCFMSHATAWLRREEKISRADERSII
jgi:hypothetical protein